MITAADSRGETPGCSRTRISSSGEASELVLELALRGGHRQEDLPGGAARADQPGAAPAPDGEGAGPLVGRWATTPITSHQRSLTLTCWPSAGPKANRVAPHRRADHAHLGVILLVESVEEPPLG